MCLSPTIAQAALFPAVKLDARADLGSWDAAHGVTGVEVRDFQNFTSPHSQQSQTTVISGPLTTEQSLAHAEDYL